MDQSGRRPAHVPWIWLGNLSALFLPLASYIPLLFFPSNNCLLDVPLVFLVLAFSLKGFTSSWPSRPDLPPLRHPSTSLDGNRFILDGASTTLYTHGLWRIFHDGGVLRE